MREAAAKGVSEAFGKRVRLFSLITNTLAKDKEIIDTWRRYPRPASSRNRANMVEDEVVDALVAAVVESFPRLSHRYYAMKAKWLGLPKLQHWDRNAPLPEEDDRLVPWPEAVERVMGSYAAFSGELASVAKPFFERPWIDAALRPGKSSGAFAHPTVPSAHPYLLLNYHGKPRDVMTLAHELGHGVHQVLAGGQGYLLSGTPLTLAETASVFGEMLTFRGLLDAETDPRRRRAMLAGKVEDMLNTVVRQIAFYRFETRLHDERRKGEIAHERIGEIWMEVQRESLGPAFEFTPDYGVYWAYIPHFVHTPFYVYAYAFGDCLVNALYGVYREGAVPDFERQVPRPAARGRHAAAQGAAGALRARRLRPGLLEARARRDLRLHRRDRARGCLSGRQSSALRRDAPDGAHLGRRGRHRGAGGGAALPRHPHRQGGACGGPEGDPRRAEGPADEGGAVPLHRAGRAAGGVRAAARHAPGRTRRPWAGTSCAGAWRASWGRAGSGASSPSGGKRRPLPRSARCTAPPCRTGGRWRASCNTRTCRAWWRRISASSSWP